MAGTNLDKRFDAAEARLIEAANKAGVDVGIMVKISGFESGFNSHARPISTSHPEKNTVTQFDGTKAISSAYGYGQFLDSTWNQMIHKYGEKYGIEGADKLTKAQTNAPEIRDNPKLQAAMLAEFTRENVEKGKRLGGPDADANVYALHNLGAGDGPKFLTALKDHPNQRVDQVLSSSVINGNPALYGDGSRSVADAYKVMGQTMDRYEKYAVQATQDPANKTNSADQPSATAKPPSASPANGALASHAVFNEAYKHFIDTDQKFEYGRSDMTLKNKSANGKTDGSRTEQDLDGDGRRGVDCSSLVWRGLKDAGYNVGKSPFGTSTLFEGKNIQPYAKEHFDVTSAADARKPNGSLQAGDVLMFKSSHGQHVGIFKGYDKEGHIQFLGSQVSTGPALATVKPGGYWDGADFQIVGALRPKPEFQTRAPLHGNPDGASSVKPAPGKPESAAPTQEAPKTNAPAAKPGVMADGMMKVGEKGPEITAQQVLLNRLGYTGENGKPLKTDGEFGPNTLAAVKQFQHDHDIKDSGIIGPKTLAALAAADKQLLTNPSNPNNELFKQVLGKVNEAEAQRKIPSGDHSEKLAAALTVEALREGITKVDRVELNNTGGSARAVQVSATRDESALNRNTDSISVPQAMKQPVRESSEQAVQVATNVQAQQQDQQRTQTQPQAASR